MCGVAVGPSWCTTNAPTLTESSNVQCDDFDDGTLSNMYNWAGVAVRYLVNTRYVSPNCAMTTSDPASPGAPSLVSGAYTEHPYTDAPASATGTLAFHLFVPGGASCNGAVVGRFLGQGSSASGESDSVKLWLTVSNVAGSGASATSYDVALSAEVGAGADGGAGGTATTSTPMTVTPLGSDNGWVTLGIDITGYSIAAAGTVSATASWSYVTSKTPQKTTATTSATGALVSPGGTPELAFDVGLAPDPATGMALTTCQLYIDNVVSNVIIPK